MSESMIERVARRLTENQIRTANELFKISDPRRVRTEEQIIASVEAGWRMNEKDARAAIEAMRSPTEDMRASCGNGECAKWAPGAWKNYIDAALQD